MIPVAGSRATSAAMTTAVPRRNPYGDEIIRATQGAHNAMMDIEKLTDEDLSRIQKKYGLLAEKTKEDLKQGKVDTHTHDISKTIIEEKK